MQWIIDQVLRMAIGVLGPEAFERAMERPSRNS